MAASMQRPTSRLLTATRWNSFVCGAPINLNWPPALQVNGRLVERSSGENFSFVVFGEDESAKADALFKERRNGGNDDHGLHLKCGPLSTCQRQPTTRRRIHPLTGGQQEVARNFLAPNKPKRFSCLSSCTCLSHLLGQNLESEANQRDRYLETRLVLRHRLGCQVVALARLL